jgi:hypothetical protein
MSNLRLINETTVSASTSSVDVTDVFSADYDIYKITTNNFSTVGTTQTALDLRFLNTSGSVITNSKYDYAYLNMKADTTFAKLVLAFKILLATSYWLSLSAVPLVVVLIFIVLSTVGATLLIATI